MTAGDAPQGPQRLGARGLAVASPSSLLTAAGSGSSRAALTLATLAPIAGRLPWVLRADVLALGRRRRRDLGDRSRLSLRELAERLLLDRETRQEPAHWATFTADLARLFDPTELETPPAWLRVVRECRRGDVLEAIRRILVSAVQTSAPPQMRRVAHAA